MSDCSTNWKLPKMFPAEVRRVGDKYGLRVGNRRILMGRREAECILADLQVLLNDSEVDDGR